jgi:D-xylonolactonase
MIPDIPHIQNHAGDGKEDIKVPMAVKPIYDGVCYLEECPIWNVSQQKLYWTDIDNRNLWVYDPQAETCRLFWQGNHKVGGFAFTQQQSMVLCTDRGVYRMPHNQTDKVNGKPERLFDIPLLGSEQFNDITTDPCGRIFAGTLFRNRDKKGVLYRLEKDKEPVVVIENVGCSNGMTFSMNQKTFFHTDTYTRTITKYEYDIETGNIKSPAIFFKADQTQGLPDGITLDSDDCIWAAFWGASVVRRLSPQGNILQEISVPAIQPSSVMFGGKDLRDLYITTACQGAIDVERGLDDKGKFLGGHVFKIKTEFRGRPEWPADFD